MNALKDVHLPAWLVTLVLAAEVMVCLWPVLF